MITTTRAIKRLTALTCLIFLFLIVVAVGQASAAPAGYAYLKDHTITGSADGDLTNYCINITFYNTTGDDSGTSCYLGDHVQQSLFQDIRIYDDSDTIAFPIWAETASYTANSVRVWVNITDTIPQSGSYTLKIYYGNAAAANVFNGDLVFPFFDDFTGAAVNTTGKNGWTHWSAAGGTTTVSNGVMNQTQTIGNYNGWRSLTTYNPPISALMRLTASEGLPSVMAGLGYNNTWNTGFYSKSGGRGWSTARAGLWDIARSANYSADYRIADIKVIGTNGYYSTDGIYDTSSSAHIPTAFLGAFTCLYASSGQTNLSIDWVIIKPSTLNEPTHGTYSGEMTAPTASFTGTPTSGGNPLTVQFTDASNGGGLSYQWSFGDGSPASVEVNPEHVYSSPGTYTVSLTVSNIMGQDTHTETGYITVTLSPPEITGITGTPTSGYNPLTVSFSATVTGLDISSYHWTFGDGGTSTSPTPSHLYRPSTSGTYTVSLTVTNTAGSDTYTETDFITVLWHTTGASERPLVSPGATKAPFSMDAYNKSLFGIFGGGNWDNVTPEGIADGFIDPYVDALGPVAIIIIVASLALVMYIKTESTVLPGVITIADGGLLLWMFPYDWQFMGYGLVIIGFVATAWGLFVRRGS